MALFVDVLIKTPLGAQEVFTYSVNKDDEDKVSFGKRVEVTLREKMLTALIVNVSRTEPPFKTKDVLRVLDDEAIFTKELYELSLWLSRYYVSSLSEVVYSIISFKNAKLPHIFKIDEEVITIPKELNSDQMNAINKISASIDENKQDSFYLYGVTGSGKTEVYLESIKKVIEKGMSAIYLVPEIGLTYELVQQLIFRFGKGKIAVLHSNLTESERLGEWMRILKGEVSVVVGARSAIFAPLNNLGLIIVDEEHDSSYKSDSFVRFHARTVAYKRKLLSGATLVLGSATPSIESWYSVKENRLTLLRLKERAVKESRESKIELVTASSNSGVLSPQLIQHMKNALSKKEQVILFLNKRGFLHRLECPECGYVKMCPHCSVPLTYHKEYNKLVCHECGRMYESVNKCENCGAETTIFKSYGTELVEKEVRAHFPLAPVLRLDSDTVRKKGSFEKGIKAFRKGEADILIGTKMVAKGLNFPLVSLVGVINALGNYSGLNFRSDEELFDLIEQVAGRSGRFMKESTVLVQSSDSFIFPLQCIKKREGEKFLDETLISRKMLSLPPFTHYARLIVKCRKEDVAKNVNAQILTFVNMLILELQKSTKKNEQAKATVIESGKCSYEKLQDYYRFHTLISSKSVSTLSYLCRYVLENKKFPSNVKVVVDIDPLNLS